MNLVVFIVLGVAALGSAMISAVVGMAGGVVLLSVMTFFLDLTVIVPVHGMVQLASNSTRTLSLYRHIEWRIFLPMLVGLPIGTVVSAQLLRSIENKEVFYFLIAALILYVLFKPKKMPRLILPFWAFSLLGLVVGLLNPIVGSTGPLMAPFYLRDDLVKEQIVATKAATQSIGHLLKIPVFLYLDFDYMAYAVLIVIMSLGVIVGTRFGVRLLKTIRETTFRFIFKSALLVAAVRLLYKAMMSVAG